MTAKELFIMFVADETPRFERVLKAIPAGNRDYKPDPKSKTAVEIAAGIVGTSAMLGDLLTKSSYDFANYTVPSGKEPVELASLFVANMNALQKTAKTVAEEDWSKDVAMLMNGKEEWKASRVMMLTSFLADLVHHRGQLSTYLRAMGGKVPAIYGPSADSAESGA